MRIGVLSDTHIQSLADGQRLASRLLNGPFAQVDMILHAGDHVLPELDSCFYPLPWFAVCGNMDAHRDHLPGKRILSLENWRIGMVHGWGSPFGLEQRVIECFNGEQIDVLVFGHSHLPVCRRQGSMLLLNPGSPTDRRSAPHHSVGVLTLDAQVRGEIILLD